MRTNTISKSNLININFKTISNMEEKLLTFLISSPDNASFTPELYSNCRNFVNDANVVVLHEFNHFYNFIFKYANDDFTFRLFVHSGLADKGGIMTSGDVICQEIKGKTEFANVDISFITRKPDWFEKDQYFTIRDGAKYWNMKYFNSDAAIKQFLDETKPIRKGDLKIIGNISNHTRTIDRPKIFIGCSVKGLPIARALRESLKHDAIVHLWDDNGFFVANGVVLHELEKIVEGHDYGIFIFRPDDTIYNIKRGSNSEEIPRDNVIFEYGMFLGKHTKEKVWFLIPEPKGEFKLMTDLLGIIPLTYKKDFIDLAEKESDAQKKKQYLSDAVSGACDSIKTDISI